MLQHVCEDIYNRQECSAGTSCRHDIACRVPAEVQASVGGTPLAIDVTCVYNA